MPVRFFVEAVVTAQTRIHISFSAARVNIKTRGEIKMSQLTNLKRNIVFDFNEQLVGLMWTVHISV